MGELDLFPGGDCLECSDDLGPPPNDILRLPPPPLPSFIVLDGARENSSCDNQCAGMAQYPGVEHVELTHRRSTVDDTWFFIIGASCIAVLVLGSLITFLLLRFRAKISRKSSIQVASTVVRNKNGPAVLYPYSSSQASDSKILWATLTPRGTAHHYTTSGSSREQATSPSYSGPCKPTLAPPDPPITFDNTGYVDSDSQTPLMESYQLSELTESDGTTSSNTLRKSQRPKVSSPTRIENPNLPPLNLHPHRSVRRATLQRRDSDLHNQSPN